MEDCQSFFFYDLETSGLNAREDRIMQFAGQRTDFDLKPMGEPVNVMIKITNDALPNPTATMVTKITPQMTLVDGMLEADFARMAIEEIFTPGTVVVGYNTVRFDDEFMRALFWRNFYDPFEWEWKDERSRWDLLDVVRLTRALRPEGIEWPVTEDGKATNRLELITKLNGLKHEHAHDALSDVYATIEVAKLIKKHQKELFDFLFRIRGKNAVRRIVNLEDKRPFVYASGRYSTEFNKTTVAFPITSGRNGNVLVYDLRYDLTKIDQQKTFPIVKELCLNKCPAVAPLGVLDRADGWAKIGLDLDTIKHNLRILLEHPEFAEKIRMEAEEKTDFPEAVEPEAALYDGFLGTNDTIKVAAVRNADQNHLADFWPDFDDNRLSELLLHYKGRNYPLTLAESEMQKYRDYRKARIARQTPKFLAELEQVYKKDKYIAEELRLYYESLLDFE